MLLWQQPENTLEILQVYYAEIQKVLCILRKKGKMKFGACLVLVFFPLSPSASNIMC